MAVLKSTLGSEGGNGMEEQGVAEDGTRVPWCHVHVGREGHGPSVAQGGLLVRSV